MQAIKPTHSLCEMFSGLVEQVFMVEIGICDTRLTRYLSEVLADFVHIDQIYRLRTVTGEAIREISRMQTEAELGPDVADRLRTRLVNKYIGDFTLFWSGIYPEQLRAKHSGVDRLYEYLLQGKHSYGIASDLTRDGDQPNAALLQHLSEQFECCVHGLHLVRANWEQLAQSSQDN